MALKLETRQAMAVLSVKAPSKDGVCIFRDGDSRSADLHAIAKELAGQPRLDEVRFVVRGSQILAFAKDVGGEF